MTSATEYLSQFLGGDISLGELEEAFATAASDERRNSDFQVVLDEAFASGRLPTQVYQLLKARIESGSGQQGATLVPELDGPPVDATRLPEPGFIGHDADTHNTVLVTAGRESIKSPESTRIVGHTSEAAGRHTPYERTENITRPFPSETGQFSRAPKSGDRASGPTGSNWSRPEQWTETRTGAIGPGSVINDRFEIVEQLGKGGMGIVFKARDRRKIEASDTDPYIAIKILSDEFRNHPQALVALQREATKAQSLAHPNIVTVYDFDRDGTTVYMTMELLRGQSLSDFARKFRRGAPPKQAAPVIEGMAEGLAYAHKRNIVHSDFKPGNVFLSDDGRVKILDFGIARATLAHGTRMGGTVDFDAGDLGAMTPGYASLEMFNGEPPDPADDVYALAVTAYQLLCGDHPYGRRTAAEAIVAKKEPRPIAGISRRQWRTISQGLALRREDRISDASQFLRLFRGPSRVARISSAVIAVLTLSVAYFAWMSVREPGPDVPFGELPAQVQAEFNERIAAARAMPPAFANQAIELYIETWDLHPRNPIAQESMDDAVRQYVEQIPQDLERLTRDRQDTEWRLAVSDALENINRWQENEYLAKSRDLDTLRSALEEMRKQD